MRKLPLYILGRFLAAWFMFQLFLLALFVIVELFEMREFYTADAASLANLATYISLRAPFLGYISSPVALILATIFVIAARAHLSEIIAAQAGGITLMRYASPIIVATFVLASLLAAGAEWKVPDWSDRADYLRRVVIQKKLPPRVEFRDLAFAHDGGYVLAERYEPASNILETVALVIPSPTADEIVSIRSFPTLTWHDNGWWTAGGESIPVPHPKYVELVAPSGGVRLLSDKPIEALRVSTLAREAYDIAGLAAANPSDRRLRGEVVERMVKISSKLALPASLPFLALIGICLGARVGRRSGLGAAIGNALVTALGYMLLLQTSANLGLFAARSTAMQPIAVWFPWLSPVILAGFALVFVRRSRFAN